MQPNTYNYFHGKKLYLDLKDGKRLIIFFEKVLRPRIILHETRHRFNLRPTFLINRMTCLILTVSLYLFTIAPMTSKQQILLQTYTTYVHFHAEGTLGLCHFQ